MAGAGEDQTASSETRRKDAIIANALACPCVKDLKEGECGSTFVAAFSCFHRSTDIPQGYDCTRLNLDFSVSVKNGITARCGI